MLGNFIRVNFTDKGFSQKLAENMLDNIKIIKDMDRELIHMPTEINTLESG